MIFYTNLFIPKRFAATTYGPIIFIRPEKKDDMGLLAHEKVHVKQFWHNPLFGLWYFFSKKSRFEYELAAYKVQAAFNPERRERFAELLSTCYGLDITKEEALKALM
jgi:hypothetical protein